LQNECHILQISIKSGKDSTSTLSLVITNGEIKKKPANKYISIQGGGETQETIQKFDFRGFQIARSEKIK